MVGFNYVRAENSRDPRKIRSFCTIKEVTALDKGKWEAYRDHHCVDVPWKNLIKTVQDVICVALYFDHTEGRTYI